MIERVEPGARSKHPAVEDFRARGLFACTRRRVIVHFDVDLHFRLLFGRALLAGARDNFERPDARSASDGQRIILCVAGALVQAADDGAVGEGRSGQRYKQHRRRGESADHGLVPDAGVVELFCAPPAGPRAIDANNVSKSTEPWVFGISAPGASGSTPAGSMAM